MFSKRCFSDWCVQRVVRIRKGRRHQNALKYWCFQKGLSSVASRGEESEKHHLENTVWNPYQKSPRVHKIFVRNSGAGNGCANFMDAWKKCVRSAGKTMSIKFLVFRGGVFWVLGGGGGECRFYFYGRADFSDLRLYKVFVRPRGSWTSAQNHWVMDVRAEDSIFLRSKRWGESFWAGYPRGRPRDIRPKNFMFRLLFRS